MGQAFVDLPDQLAQTSAALPAGVDDLLARLAGEQVLRLLAGTDVAPMKNVKAGSRYSRHARHAVTQSLIEPAVTCSPDTISYSSTAIEEQLSGDLGEFFDELDDSRGLDNAQTALPAESVPAERSPNLAPTPQRISVEPSSVVVEPQSIEIAVEPTPSVAESQSIEEVTSPEPFRAVLAPMPSAAAPVTEPEPQWRHDVELRKHLVRRRTVAGASDMALAAASVPVALVGDSSEVVVPASSERSSFSPMSFLSSSMAALSPGTRRLLGYVVLPTFIIVGGAIIYIFVLH